MFTLNHFFTQAHLCCVAHICYKETNDVTYLMKQITKCMALIMVFVLAMGFSLIGISAVEGFDSEGFMQGEPGRDTIAQAQFDMSEIFETDELGNIIYPDFVGGVFFNHERNVVLQIVERYASRDASSYRYFREFADDNSNVMIEYVEFSFNELESIINVLNALLQSEPEIFANICMYSIDAINNRIEVRLFNYTEEEITCFKENIFNAPMIAFSQFPGTGGFLVGGYDTAAHTLWIFFAILAIGLLSVLAVFFIWRQALSNWCKCYHNGREYRRRHPE